jgi:hypothetical protein
MAVKAMANKPIINTNTKQHLNKEDGYLSLAHLV